MPTPTIALTARVDWWTEFERTIAAAEASLERLRLLGVQVVSRGRSSQADEER